MSLPHRLLSPLTMATAIVAVIGGISFSATAAQADTTDPASPGDVQSAPDESTASSLAASEGHAVRVDSETTEMTAVSVQPDGTRQLEADTLPVRTQDNGAWVPIDESLVTGGSGMLEPQTPLVPVRFAAGGSNVLDQVQTDGGDWVSETWPFGDLPTPTVSGDTATYQDALPGVDVQLTATATGMSSLLVVKTPAAAADSRLASFKLGVHGATLSTAPADTLVAKTSDGATVTAGSPLWWDSAQGGNDEGPGGNEPNRPVAHTDDSTGMTLDVASTVAAANPTYPVFVDPDWSSGITSSWYTDKAYPSQSYLTAAESDVLRVGIYAQYESHMFFQFPMTALAGKDILDASLDMTQQSLDACPTNAITLYTYGPQTAGFTWNGESGTWHASLGSKTPGTCSNPGADVAVGWDVTSAVASAAGDSNIQFGLKSASSAQSRRHFSRAAKLTVSYNTPPNNPSSQTWVTPSRTCATSSSAPAYINSNQALTFRVNQTDPDAGNVAVDFYVNQATTGTLWVKHTTALQAQGAISWTYSGPAFTNGYLYAWRAQGSDYTDTSSGYTPWCYFRIDNTAPASPTVTPSGTWPPLVVGQGVGVALGNAGSTDVAGYEYWIQDGATTSPAASVPVSISKSGALPANGSRSMGAGFVGSSTTTITVAPIDGKSVLWVASYDNAGNVSVPTSLLLANGDGTSAGMPTNATNLHGWIVSAQPQPLGASVPDTDTTEPQPLSVGSGVGRTTDVINGSTVPVLSFDGTLSAAMTAATAGQAVNTVSSFSVSVWVDPQSTTGVQTIVAQSGTTRPGFVLESVGGKMTFCKQPQTGSTSCVAATNVSPANTWVLVTGMWDAVNDQVRLMLNGDPAQVFVTSYTPTSTDAATGAVTVGSQQLNGAPAYGFNGKLTDPVLVQEVLDSDTESAAGRWFE